MEKAISDVLKLNRILSAIVLFLGLALLIFMVTVEGEPGALPLLLVLSGGIWFLITCLRIRKRSGKKA